MVLDRRVSGPTFLEPEGSQGIRNRRTASRFDINALPVEILGEIFHICKVDQNPKYHPFAITVRNADRAPVLLTHICRIWRSICLSLPGLWSSFTLSNVGSPRYSSLDRIVGTWLQRSRNMALKIDISFCARPWVPPSVISALLSHANRWQAVSFCAQDELMNGFLSLPPSATPAMKALINHSTHEEFLVALPKLAEKLRSLPSIDQIYLDLFGYPDQMYLDVLADIPFERMVHVKIQACLSLDDCMYLLRRCVSAVEISLGQVSDELRSSPKFFLSSGDRSEVTCLPKLRSLIIETSISVSIILRMFRCPSLSHLYIKDTHFTPLRKSVVRRDQLVVNSFIKGCRLEQLIICDSGRSWEDAKYYLTLDGIRKVPEVEIRVLDARRQQGPITSSGCRCRATGCRFPHLGWTSHPRMHLGNPLPATWANSLWKGYQHETEHFSWNRNIGTFFGFEDQVEE